MGRLGIGQAGAESGRQEDREGAMERGAARKKTGRRDTEGSPRFGLAKSSFLFVYFAIVHAASDIRWTDVGTIDWAGKSLQTAHPL